MNSAPGKSASQSVRLLLADDHPGVLEEIRNLLSAEFDVAGTANNGLSLVKAAQELRPDIVVTDVRMPGLSGIAASRRILESQLCKAVIALAIYKDAQLVKTAFDAGILSYVLKDNAGEDLIPAIRLALKGERFVSRGVQFDPAG